VISEGDPLARFLRDEIAKGAMPGVSWWVGGPLGAIASGASGHASLEPTARPLRNDTPFDLASLTKPLATALLATILDCEGVLPLDRSLASVFAELRATAFGPATLREAAAHRAGFPAWAPLYLSATTRDGYIAAIARAQPARPRGDTLYSDLGYVLLGIAVERATGMPLDRAFDERVARPLALSRCGFPSASRPFRDAAATSCDRSYERELAGLTENSDRFRAEVPPGEVSDGNAFGLGGVAGHAGLFGTTADVAAIALALIDPRLLGLAPDALDAMFRPIAAGAGGRTVGFLRAADSESVQGVLPDDAVGHLGFTGTSVWIDRAIPRAYVLLTNRVHPRVPKVPFTPTRRAFHELAAALP
jgi:CubicO group peptidase (beta-lactamase class C family)